MFTSVTLYVVGIMSGVVSVAVLGSLLHSGIPGLYRWVAANTLIVVGFLLLALDGDVPAAWAVVLSSTLFTGAALLVLQGFRQFFGIGTSPFHELATFAVLVFGIVYWTYVEPSVNARGMLMSAFIAYVRLLVGWTVYSMRPPHRPRYSYLFVTTVAILGSAVHVARVFAVALGLESHTQFLEATPMNVAFLALGIVSLSCLSIGAVMLAYDRMAESMERLATIDELTGALTRREFVVRAELQLERASRAETPVAIAVIDLDNFKALNDSHGHAAGDHALSFFSSIVSRGIRRGDIFGRLGGEEFAVLFPATSAADAAVLVDRLRMQIAAATLALPSGKMMICTFSAGVDQYRADETLASLMARADAALYSAKGTGKNRIVSVGAADEPPAMEMTVSG